MKRKASWLGIVVLLAASGVVLAGDALSTLNMGLSKTSVFDMPSPEPFTHAVAEPGESQLLPRAFVGAPPQVSHVVADFLPIEAGLNECVDCHDKKEWWSKKKIRKGKVIPIPKTHYISPRTGELGEEVSGSRYFCMQCHVPQAQVKDLVINTMKPLPLGEK